MALTKQESALFLSAAVSAARGAGSLLQKRFATHFQIAHKGVTDLVTEMDKKAERLILRRLEARFPGHGFMAEETRPRGASNADHVWIIDPLDGTTNYAHAFPWFAVSIALAVRGRTEVGVVYHPLGRELYTAVRGGGAFCNGRRINVSRRSRLIDSVLATGFPYDLAQNPFGPLNSFCNFSIVTRGIRRAGVASLDLACVAAGRFDGFWEQRLQPWDVAAGVLLVQEAGGFVSDFRGGPDDGSGREVLASNGRIHRDMIRVLATGPRRVTWPRSHPR